MPKRTDIHKIMIIGSGPIVIGEACEFDYSGAQAIKALKSLGYKIVLVNSNPATITTDIDRADCTYIEPLSQKRLEAIIDKERPQAILPNFGGKLGLNLCLQLADKGILDKYQIEIIGASITAIKSCEDRLKFRQEMNKLGFEIAKSEVAHNMGEALAIAKDFHYPVMLRPLARNKLSGGGLVYNKDELKASMEEKVLIEESLLGWQELELEIVRDRQNNIIPVCLIENIDPVGIHTGDSLSCSPMLTVAKNVQKRLIEKATKIIEALEIIGGINVQFAYDKKTDRIFVTEVNPRTGKTAAFASKATGFPLAFFGAMLEVGLTLDEIASIKQESSTNFKPDEEAIILKFPRWDFEKFSDTPNKLGTQMRSVGEVISFGKTYKEALQKALRSLENDTYGLGDKKNTSKKTKTELVMMLKTPTSDRYFIIYEALKKGVSVKEIEEITKIKPYFLEQIKELADEEIVLELSKGQIPDEESLKRAKKDGFSDRYLGTILDLSEEVIRKNRLQYNIKPNFAEIKIKGEKDKSYYYSTYAGKDRNPISLAKPKVMILGGGANQIGQGIEFDYCCVHAAFALQKLGFESIMVNCNPEAISTNPDVADKLYFEPLTWEEILNVYEKEKPIGIIMQFGGQTPLNLATQLAENGATILGTSSEMTDLAEDRDLFRALMEKAQIPMPEAGLAIDPSEAVIIAKSIGYPVMVRPSYVLGGRKMEVIYDDESMYEYMEKAIGISPDHPILIDRFLNHALECEVDAICDGEQVFIPTVMEHIERAGVHSGDSACIIPAKHISLEDLETIKNYTKKIAVKMGIRGFINIQYAIEGGRVFVLEANPRASRTVPLVSKMCQSPLVSFAVATIMANLTKEPLLIKDFRIGKIPYYGVKEAVFSFELFPEIDPVLGPEMRSSGEVLGLSSSFGEAFYKAKEAASQRLPNQGNILISVNKRDKKEVIEIAKRFKESGFFILATTGTHELLKEAKIETKRVNKLTEGRPNILDLIINGEIDLIINSPVGKESIYDDSYLRKRAIKEKIPYITTMAAALAAIEGIETTRNKEQDKLKSIQQLQEEIKEDEDGSSI